MGREGGREGERGSRRCGLSWQLARLMPECQLAATCCWLRVGCECNRRDEPLGEELSDKSLMNENMK